jgi:hypothetical protein
VFQRDLVRLPSIFSEWPVMYSCDTDGCPTNFPEARLSILIRPTNDNLRVALDSPTTLGWVAGALAIYGYPFTRLATLNVG